MKTYETAYEFLASIVDLHKQAATKVLDVINDCSDQRTKMALTYLHEYQQRMRDSLAHYLKDSEQNKLLDTWLPYTLNDAPTPESFLAGLSLSADMSSDSVAKIGQGIADYVVQLLEGVTASIASTALAEVVDNLLAQERNERKKLTRAMNSLDDL